MTKPGWAFCIHVDPYVVRVSAASPEPIYEIDSQPINPGTVPASTREKVAELIAVSHRMTRVLDHSSKVA